MRQNMAVSSIKNNFAQLCDTWHIAHESFRNDPIQMCIMRVRADMESLPSVQEFLRNTSSFFFPKISIIVPDLTRFLAHSRNEVFRAQASRLANALFFWNCNAHLFRLWTRFRLPPFVSHEPLMNFCPKFHRFNSATQTRCDIKHSHHFIINPVFKHIQHLALEFDQRPSAGGFSPRPARGYRRTSPFECSFLRPTPGLPATITLSASRLIFFFHFHFQPRPSKLKAV